MGNQDYNSQPDLARALRDMQQQIDALKRAQSGIASGRFYDEVLPEVTTSSSTYVDLGGPAITVTVPTGGFVAIMCQADIKSSGTNIPTIGIFEATDFATPEAIFQPAASPTYATFLLNGAPGSKLGGRAVYPASAGQRSYSLRYGALGGGTGSAFFRNQRLWLQVI